MLFSAQYLICRPVQTDGGIIPGWAGTLTAHGLEEHMRVSLIFAIIISFMKFTVFTLANVLYFEEFMIHDSRGFVILKNN